jgi:hypothetical protein
MESKQVSRSSLLAQGRALLIGLVAAPLAVQPAAAREDADGKRLRYLLDRQEILDCLTRVSRGIDRFDRDLFLSAFHPDGTIQLGGHPHAPRETYEQTIALLEKSHYAGLHNILNHTCELTGDVAHAETYFQFLARNRDETNRISAGRYIDRLERRGGQWKIASRATLVECAGVIPPKTAPAIEKLFAQPGTPGAPSRDRSDPSYRR